LGTPHRINAEQATGDQHMGPRPTFGRSERFGQAHSRARHARLMYVSHRGLTKLNLNIIFHP
jgi:hypothetical protein